MRLSCESFVPAREVEFGNTCALGMKIKHNSGPEKLVAGYHGVCLDHKSLKLPAPPSKSSPRHVLMLMKELGAQHKGPVSVGIEAYDRIRHN
ncbi:predicted protein [Botrytis cinerea T4]|uniref:Uncharacterized protein n=1 Tax=Botryotinia fuckeliana (strain T4) TaxID=999810 RepID=G2XXZ2_BOTF4|nr:predicted protein [Botrytis cinerea T4]